MSNPPSVMNNNIRKLIKSNKLYSRNDLHQLNEKFARFGYLNPYNILNTTREYIFFTKPDLHLFEGSKTLNTEIKSDPFFIECVRKYYNQMRALQSSYSDTTPGPFITLLSSCVSSNLDLPAITAEDSDSAANVFGTSITYARSSERSDEKHEFSLEFDDHDRLQVYHLFKIWDEYERKKDLGIISPTKWNYIENKILHDQVSVYKIIVGEDYESIVYYAKLFGVIPKGVPRETFSSLKDEELKYSVNFHAEFVEDMNPLIISDFNNDVSSYKNQFSEDIPFYDDNINAINGELCHVPYIHTGDYRYKLRWR